MKALKLISSILSFFIQNRQGGTSTTIGEIAKDKDVYVLIVERSQMKQEMYAGVDKNKFITLEDLIENRFFGLTAQPVLVDNYVMLKIAETVMKKIESDDERIRKSEGFIKDLYYTLQTQMGEGAARYTITSEAPDKRKKYDEL